VFILQKQILWKLKLTTFIDDTKIAVLCLLYQATRKLCKSRQDMYYFGRACRGKVKSLIFVP
jgi:hypothetical protein